MNKMISIIIPIYNSEKTLDRCLNSCCSQTYKNIEIICINDGSTDNSLCILNKYIQKDSRIKIINKKNGGLSSARNEGLKIAQGEWICFVDSDDYIDLNFCEELLKRAIETKSDFVICPTILSDINQNLIILPPYHEFVHTTFKDKVKMLRGGAVWDKIYSHKFLKKYNILFEEGHNWEGNLFLLKVARYSECFSSTIKTFYHYIHNNNPICHSKTDVDKRINDRLFVLRSIFDWATKEQLNHKDMRAVLSLIERSVVDGGFYKEHFKQIIKKVGLKNYFNWRKLKKFRPIK